MDPTCNLTFTAQTLVLNAEGLLHQQEATLNTRNKNKLICKHFPACVQRVSVEAQSRSASLHPWAFLWVIYMLKSAACRIMLSLFYMQSGLYFLSSKACLLWFLWVFTVLGLWFACYLCVGCHASAERRVLRRTPLWLNNHGNFKSSYDLFFSCLFSFLPCLCFKCFSFPTCYF